MGLELLSGLLDRCALLLEPAFVGSEGFLHLNDPALPLRQVPCLGLQVLGIPLKIGVHLMDSLGLSHPILLQLGASRSDLRLESVQGIRPLREFRRMACDFFPEAPFSRIDFEGSLLDFALQAFRFFLQQRGGPGRFLGGFLAARDFLFVLRDPLDIRVNLFLLVLHIDLAALEAHHAGRPRFALGDALLFERFPLLLE